MQRKIRGTIVRGRRRCIDRADTSIFALPIQAPALFPNKRVANTPPISYTCIESIFASPTKAKNKRKQKQATWLGGKRRCGMEIQPRSFGSTSSSSSSSWFGKTRREEGGVFEENIWTMPENLVLSWSTYETYVCKSRHFLSS